MFCAFSDKYKDAYLASLMDDQVLILRPGIRLSVLQVVWDVEGVWIQLALLDNENELAGPTIWVKVV